MMKRLSFVFIFLTLAMVAGAQADKVGTLQGLESGAGVNQGSGLMGIMKSASRLFGSKDDLTSVLMIVPAGDTVSVIGSDSTYFHVLYYESEGYILRKHINVQTPSVQQEQTEQQVDNQSVQQNNDQGNRFSYLEKKYGTNMAARLIAGKIWKGMTSDMVRDSWGSPVKINRVIETNVIKEEWIFSNSWLFFENDVLSQWGPVR
jgi:hypothetical protein